MADLVGVAVEKNVSLANFLLLTKLTKELKFFYQTTVNSRLPP